jgi:predicted transcriptional regulator
MVLIGFFLRQAAEASYVQVVVSSALKGVKVGDIMKTEVVTVSPELTIQDLVDSYFFKYHYDSFPVSQEGGLLGLVSLNDLKKLPRERWRDTHVRDVMQTDLSTLSVARDEDVALVLRRAVRDQTGTLPVVEADQLVGIITRRDIMEALRVFSDLGH